MLARQVRHEDSVTIAWRGQQLTDELLGVRVGEVEFHGGLAAVEPGPVQALARSSDRPPVNIGRAADRVDPDDVGTQLGQGEPSRRRRDEAGDLDDGDAVQHHSRAPRFPTLWRSTSYSARGGRRIAWRPGQAAWLG